MGDFEAGWWFESACHVDSVAMVAEKLFWAETWVVNGWVGASKECQVKCQKGCQAECQMKRPIFCQ